MAPSEHAGSGGACASGPSMAKAGFDRVPLELLIRARDHGVDGRFAKRAKSRHGDDLTLAEIIRLKDHGELD